MAKQPQDEINDQTKTAGRENQFGVRDFGRENQAAGREAQSASREGMAAARHAQQAMAELTASAFLQPYAQLMQEIDSFNRDWAARTRSTVERSLDLALRLNETFVSQIKHSTDLYLRIYETDISAHTAMTRDLQDRASSAARRFGAAAE